MPFSLSCDRIHAYLHPNEGKIGFIDHKGKFVIQPQYQWIQGFKGNVAAVSTKTTRKSAGGSQYDVVSEFGAINLQGVTVVPLKYDTTRAIGVGFIMAHDETNETEHSFLFDEAGQSIWKGVGPQESPEIHVEFNGDARDGLAPYRLLHKDGTSENGFVDKHGNRLFKTVYIHNTGSPARVYSEPFGEGLVWAVDKQGPMLVNLEGQVTARFKSVGVTLWEENPFAGGFSAVATNFKKGEKSMGDRTNWGYVNTQCEWVVPGLYDEAHDFSDGLACVLKGGFYGFVDATGKEVITPQFADVDMYGFQDGYCAVQKVKDGPFYFIDHQGRKAFGREYEEANGFQEGVAAVRVKGRWGFINLSGEFVIQPRFKMAGSFHSGLAAASE